MAVQVSATGSYAAPFARKSAAALPAPDEHFGTGPNDGVPEVRFVGALRVLMVSQLVGTSGGRFRCAPVFEPPFLILPAPNQKAGSGRNSRWRQNARWERLRKARVVHWLVAGSYQAPSPSIPRLLRPPQTNSLLPVQAATWPAAAHSARWWWKARSRPDCCWVITTARIRINAGGRSAPNDHFRSFPLHTAEF